MSLSHGLGGAATQNVPAIKRRRTVVLEPQGKIQQQRKINLDS